MGAGTDLVKILAQSLIPPTDGNPEHVFRYRLGVSCSIILGGVVVAGHIAWACGFLAWAGLQGFASGSELHALEQKFDVSQQSESSRIASLQLLNIRRDIKENVISQCKARYEGNQTALSYATQSLEESRDQYRAITGSDARVPACEELLISTRP